MDQLKRVFKIETSANNTVAELLLNDDSDNLELLDEMEFTEEDITQFLSHHHINYGLVMENIEKVVSLKSENEFPLLIAKGVSETDGEHGTIRYYFDRNTEVDRSEGWDFREVMRIPTVTGGDKLATLIPPTSGEHGRTVQDKEIPAKPGKPYRMKTGKNVVFDSSNNSFYATTEGQVSFGVSSIHVHTVYEVNDDISLKTGNIDFVGTVIIHGDVPSGFTIKATGDIKIFGLVEAATITAEGSVFIAEGLAGLKNGLIEAGEDIHISYVNQGNMNAGNSIYVEHSILHSICSAKHEIICKEGSIIGGILSSGYKIEAKEIGNRLHTLTEFSFGVDKVNYNEMEKLAKEKDVLTDNLRKLDVLKIKLSQGNQQSSKTRVTLLKLRHSYHQTEEKIAVIEEQLVHSNAELGKIEDAYLLVKHVLYPNTTVSFGKYKRTIDRNYDSVLIKMESNEIKMMPL